MYRQNWDAKWVPPKLSPVPSIFFQCVGQEVISRAVSVFPLVYIDVLAQTDGRVGICVRGCHCAIARDGRSLGRDGDSNAIRPDVFLSEVDTSARRFGRLRWPWQVPHSGALGDGMGFRHAYTPTKYKCIQDNVWHTLY
jgi:hypothetical protein